MESTTPLEELKKRSIELGAMPLKKEKIKIILEDLKEKENIFYLEVGSGIGWSFLNLQTYLDIKKAVLIEKDKDKFDLLKKNVSKYKKPDILVEFIRDDALNYLKNTDFTNFKDYYKVALIDANKSKYKDYYLTLKNDFDLLIFDNSFFYLTVSQKKRYKTLIKKMKEFHQIILEDKNNKVVHYKIYDGLSFVYF